MKDYTKNLATVQRILTKFGLHLTYIKFDEDSQDVAKPWGLTAGGRVAPDETVSMLSVNVPFSGTSSNLGLSAEKIDLINACDLQLIAAPPSGNQNVLDMNVVTYDGADYSIKLIDRLKPADVTLLYFIGASR